MINLWPRSWNYYKHIENKSRIITKIILRKNYANDKIIKENEKKNKMLSNINFFKIVTWVIKSKALQIIIKSEVKSLKNQMWKDKIKKKNQLHKRIWENILIKRIRVKI